MITKKQAEITARVYSILAAGQKYQWRHTADDTWSKPFGLEDMNSAEHPLADNLEIRMYKEPREFIIGLDSTGFAVAVGNDRVMLLCGNNSSADVASQIRVREIVKGES